MNNIMFSLENSIDILSKEVDKINYYNKIDDNKKLYKAIGDCLNWIYCVVERIDKTKLSSGEKLLISAFRGAANIQKHTLKLDEFNGFENFINCCRFPMEFPFVFTENPALTWKPFDEDIINSTNEIKNYNKILANKEILKTINDFYRIAVRMNEVKI